MTTNQFYSAFAILVGVICWIAFLRHTSAAVQVVMVAIFLVAAVVPVMAKR